MDHSNLDPVSLGPDSVEWVEFQSEISGGPVFLCQYRDRNGALFTCVHYSLGECRRMIHAQLRQQTKPEERLDLADLEEEPSRG